MSLLRALAPGVLKLAQEHKLQGEAEVQGIEVAIENRKGSVREGTTEDGHHWRTKMKFPYGYLKGTKGADGEEVDAYVGPDKDAPNAYVVHQHKPDGTGFDEDKVMLGFDSEEEARKAYLEHYDDPKFLGPISTVPVEKLKAKIEKGGVLRKIAARVLRPAEGEHAPGIPESRAIHPIPRVFHDRPETWHMAVQHHAAERAGCFTADTLVGVAGGKQLPIADVKEGMFALVPQGLARVNRVWYNGECDEWFEVVAGDRKVTCTGNHPFFVLGIGWVPISNLEGAEAEVTPDGKIKLSSEQYAESLGQATKRATPSVAGLGLASAEVRSGGVVAGGDGLFGRLLQDGCEECLGEIQHPATSRLSDRESQKENSGREQLELAGREVQREGVGLEWQYLATPSPAAEVDREPGRALRVVRKHQTDHDAPSSSVQVLRGTHGGECSLALPEMPQRGRRTISGVGREVLRIRRLPRVPRGRFDLEIEQAHCYYAGGFLVHNSHIDLRLVDTRGLAHSWAIPKGSLPAPGQKTLAVQQPTHTREYAAKKGTFELPEGYGKGTVRASGLTPVEVVRSQPGLVRFNVYGGPKEGNQEFALIKTPKGHLLHNITATAETGVRGTGGHPIPQSKPAYREITTEKVRFDNADEIHQAKVDGAHVTFHLRGDKGVKVFSYRPTERATGVLEHTHKLPDYRGLTVPPGLSGTVLRGELYGADKKTGKALPAEQTGGLLNATVWRSREKQQALGAELKPVIFDVVTYKGRDVSNAPYSEKLQILKEVEHKIPRLKLPPTATTPQEKEQLFHRIREGKEPITGEGIIAWKLPYPYPTKAKFRPDVDAEIVGVTTGKGKHEGRIGALQVRLPGKDAITNVGTGYSDELRSEIAKNPQSYIGRVAKIRTQQVFPSGRLRAPSFAGFHIEKGKQPGGM